MRLPVGSYDQPGRNAGRLVNVYAERSSGKAPVNLIPLPGITTQNAFTGGGRGLTVALNRVLAVAGTTLYDGVSGASLGTLPGSEVLTFASNDLGETVFSNNYYYQTSVALLSDPDAPAMSSVDYVDGYIVASERDTDRFYCSAVRDATSWNGLDYSGTIASSDKLIRLIVDHNQVILFGTQSTEIFWLNGGEGFPFQRMANGTLEIGAIAKLGVCKADNSVFWLASDRTIRRLSGSTPVKVSQSGVEEKLATYTVDDCIAFSFTWQGNVFVWFRFPTENASWVYNATANEWFESDIPLVSSATLNGRMYVQHEDGSVGYLSSTAVNQFGEVPRYSITFPNVYSGQNRQFFSQFDAVFSTGYVEAGVVPEITLDVSHDGGSIYHTLPIRNLGNTGEYGNVVRWNRLGAGRDTVFRLTWDYPCALTDAQIEAQAGMR